MLQSNEIISLLLFVGVLLFALYQRNGLSELPARWLLLMSFGVLLFGRVFTIVEGFFLGELFNALEHACYAISSLLLLWWCARALGGRGSAKWTE